MIQKNITKIKKLISIKIIGCICFCSIANAQAQLIDKERTYPIENSYIDSKDELKDYILDTGDEISISFLNAPELNQTIIVDAQGEIFLTRSKETYVRGLTIKELTDLLEKRYLEFLIDPEIHIQITKFKPIRISVRGEVRTPGLISFDALLSTQDNFIPLSNNRSSTLINQINIDENQIKKQGVFVSTLSNALKEAGGLTSFSDISKIEIIRDVPISSGGGKKKAIVDLTPYLNNSNSDNDIRLFDGDSIYIPSLTKANPSIMPLSILSGLSPNFIEVIITGRIDNPGKVSIPTEGSLSDVMNLTGPRKPLAGKIFLIRYNEDGSLLRKSINYSSSASPGSLQNPYLISGDLISVQNSIIGKTSGIIKEVTAPFVGIYSVKKLIQDFNK